MNILAAVQLWDSTTDPHNWIFYTDPSHYPAINAIFGLGHNVFFWAAQFYLGYYTLKQFMTMNRSIFTVAQRKIKTFNASVAGFTDGGMAVWLARRALFIAFWLAYFQILFGVMWALIPSSVGQAIFLPLPQFSSLQTIMTSVSVTGVPIGQHAWQLLNYFIPVGVIFSMGVYMLTVELFTLSTLIVTGVAHWLSPE